MDENNNKHAANQGNDGRFGGIKLAPGRAKRMASTQHQKERTNKFHH